MDLVEKMFVAGTMLVWILGFGSIVGVAIHFIYPLIFRI